MEKGVCRSKPLEQEARNGNQLKQCRNCGEHHREKRGTDGEASMMRGHRKDEGSGRAQHARGGVHLDRRAFDVSSALCLNAVKRDPPTIRRAPQNTQVL